MGGSTSIPTNTMSSRAAEISASTIRNPEELIRASTQTGTRRLMDDLLQYGLRNLSVRDFSLLSDPAQCKKYVIVMANRMQQYFSTIQIEPYREGTPAGSGILAFRSVKSLTEPERKEEKETRTHLCLQLAFFYTRVFQIYGALALTLIDDIRDTSAYTGQIHSMSAIAPGFQTESIMRGGAVPPEQLQLFDFLHEILRSTTIPKTFLFDALRVDHVDSIQLIMEQSRLDGSRPVQDAKLRMFLTTQRYFEIIVQVQGTSSQSNNKTLSVERVQYVKSRTSSPITLAANHAEFRRRFEDLPYEFTIIHQSGTRYLIRDMDVRDFIQGWFSELLSEFRERIDTAGNEDHENRDRYGYRFPSSSSSSSTSKTPGLDISFLVQHLQKERPHGHCVARALQLLQNLREQSADSYICQARFMTAANNGRKSTTDGLPELDGPLSKSPGMKATSLLFLDTIQGSHLGMSDHAKNAYKEWLLDMADLFGDRRASELIQRDELREGLGGIRNKRDQQFCGREANKMLRITDRNLVHTIYQYYRALFERQWEHVRRCTEIIEQLFLIRLNDQGHFQFQFREGIMQKGIEEVNRIAEEARDVLVHYYEDCEKKYVEALRAIRAHYTPSVPPPPSAPPAPSAPPSPSAPVRRFLPSGKLASKKGGGRSVRKTVRVARGSR